jgi:hypothetical protein
MPAVCCGVVTLVAVPVWFFTYDGYFEAASPDRNPFATVIYFTLCLISMVPVALLNAKLIAPYVAHPLAKTATYVRAFLLNALLFFAGCLAIAGWLGLLAICGAVLAGTTVLRVLAWTLWWTVILWQLAILLLPPVVAGSLAYSLVIVTLRRRADRA